MSRRRFLRRATSAALAVAASASVAAGCMPAAAPPAPTPVPSAPGAPRKGGTIRIAKSTDAKSLDPAFTCAIAAMEVGVQIHDPFLVMDEKGPHPSLATNWKISDEGKTVTFTLREGVKFHDGSVCDAVAAK